MTETVEELAARLAAEGDQPEPLFDVEHGPERRVLFDVPDRMAS